MTIFVGPALPVFYNPPEPLVISSPLTQMLQSFNRDGANIQPRRHMEAGQKLMGGDNFKQFVCDSVEDFSALATTIMEVGRTFRFCELPTPRHCQIIQSHKHHEILARYVVDYYIATDGLIGRWDFLVEYL